MKTIICECTDSSWQAELDDAKQVDAEAVRLHGQTDRCHHYVAVQSSQFRRGFLEAVIGSNRFGWCVRDTMNDGLGRMSNNMEKVEDAIQWAKDWHAKMPECRRVVMFA